MKKLDSHFVLPFDPEDEKLNPEVKEIFSRPIARAIWFAYRPNHLFHQYTNGHILALSDTFEKKLPSDPQELKGYLNEHLGNLSLEFATELFPYITGEKEIDYEVEVKLS